MFEPLVVNSCCYCSPTWPQLDFGKDRPVLSIYKSKTDRRRPPVRKSKTERKKNEEPRKVKGRQSLPT